MLSATEVTVQPLAHHHDPTEVEVHLVLRSDRRSGDLITEAVAAVEVGPDTYCLLQVPLWSDKANLGDHVIALPGDEDRLEVIAVVSRMTVARIVFHPLGAVVLSHMAGVARRNDAVYVPAPCGCVVANLFDPARVDAFERFAARNSLWHSRWDYPPTPEEPTVNPPWPTPA